MIINDQFGPAELGVLLRELNAVLARSIAGDVVELGCYKGLSSLEIVRTLRAAQSDKNVYLYDSFVGLPPKVAKDASPAGMQFRAGELPASKAEVIQLFRKAGLPLPYIKKAWFSELKPSDLPEEICLAFLDGDFYESIVESLRLVWPKLVPGAVVIVDDYQNEALPGVQKAVDEWAKAHRTKLRIESSLAIIRQS
jgi:O-methyltransferase